MILTSRTCCNSRTFGKVSRIHLIKGCLELFQASHVSICEFTFFVWWNVKKKWRSTTNRLEVDIHQFFEGFWLLVIVVEPARADGNICFSYRVHISVRVTVVKVFVLNVFGDVCFLDLVPYRVTGDTTLISNPTDTCWFSREDSDISFSFLNVFEPLIKSVGYFLGTATACSIHPDFNKFTLITVFWITKDFF